MQATVSGVACRFSGNIPRNTSSWLKRFFVLGSSLLGNPNILHTVAGMLNWLLSSHINFPRGEIRFVVDR